MHLRFLVSLLLTSLLLIPVVSAEATAAPTTKPKPENPLAELKPGDPAAKLKKLLGDPVEIRPMKAPSGKAEVWVYVTEISRRMDRIDRSTAEVVINVTEADGSVRQRITPGQVRFEDVHYVTEDMVEVLLFNEHYVLHKISRLERKL